MLGVGTRHQLLVALTPAELHFVSWCLIRALLAGRRLLLWLLYEALLDILVE